MIICRISLNTLAVSQSAQRPLSPSSLKFITKQPRFLAQSVLLFQMNNKIVAELPMWRVWDVRLVYSLLPSQLQSFVKGLAVVGAALCISAALRRYRSVAA